MRLRNRFPESESSAMQELGKASRRMGGVCPGTFLQQMDEKALGYTAPVGHRPCSVRGQSWAGAQMWWWTESFSWDTVPVVETGGEIQRQSSETREANWLIRESGKWSFSFIRSSKEFRSVPCTSKWLHSQPWVVLQGEHS